LVLRSTLATDRLDVSELPAGAYVMQIFTEQGPVQRSFTKE